MRIKNFLLFACITFECDAEETNNVNAVIKSSGLFAFYACRKIFVIEFFPRQMQHVLCKIKQKKSLHNKKLLLYPLQCAFRDNLLITNGNNTKHVHVLIILNK